MLKSRRSWAITVAQSFSNSNRRNCRHSAARAAAVLLALAACSCAAYPERPVTLILPFPATGSTDFSGIPRISKLARNMETVSTPSLTDTMVQEIQQSLAAALGQPGNVLRRGMGEGQARNRLAPPGC